MKRAEAIYLRTVVEQAAEALDDKTASTAAVLFPGLKRDGALVRAGTRINWKGTIKRAAVALWDTVDNDPEHAPNLWEDIWYRDGYRIIPETITAGLAFALDECGWWKDALYRSKKEVNVHTPEQYPNGWELVED